MTDRTWADLVREVAAQWDMPEPSDDDCDHILWEHTPWPLGGEGHVTTALNKFFAENASGVRSTQ